MKVRNEKYLIAFGNHLKKLMDAKGKSAEDVGAIGGIETKQVYRAINAEHSISISIAVALAKGLGVHPKKLFDFEYEHGD